MKKIQKNFGGAGNAILRCEEENATLRQDIEVLKQENSAQKEEIRKYQAQFAEMSTVLTSLLGQVSILNGKVDTLNNREGPIHDGLGVQSPISKDIGCPIWGEASASPLGSPRPSTPSVMFHRGEAPEPPKACLSEGDPPGHAGRVRGRGANLGPQT